ANPGRQPSRRRLASGMMIGIVLPPCLWLLVCGCDSKSRAPVHAEVSGQVLFDNNPLTGGRVTFVAVNGGFSESAVIDPKGNYKIMAPVGDVRISVDNRMLNMNTVGSRMEVAKKGAGRPEAGAPTPVQGTYVQIPKKYHSPDTSELTYTVTKEANQTHNIELKR
ncbi:MAG TPA: hypothetical protein VKE94_01220, partial [Gemmataceae bacterium]|nr:hypothetical protein [Gemmataceae bacterium]